MRLNSGLLLLLVLIGLHSQSCQVEAFELAELFRWPIDRISEKFFKWNPFKKVSPAQTSFNEADESSALYEWNVNNDSSQNSTRRYYNYGCECLNYSCSCCGHIEVNKINLNETGRSIIYTLAVLKCFLFINTVLWS
jgi:hypothetical protein